MAPETFDEIFHVTDMEHENLPVVVLDNDLHEMIAEIAEDQKSMELDELYDILDDWIFEGRN